MANAAKWFGWVLLGTVGTFVLAFPLAGLLVLIGDLAPFLTVGDRSFEEMYIRMFYFLSGAIFARALWSS